MKRKKTTHKSIEINYNSVNKQTRISSTGILANNVPNMCSKIQV